MVVAMDLNASPLPEDDEDNFESHVEQYSAPEERIESGAELARREREERRKRIKIERGDDRHFYASRQPADDQIYASNPQNSNAHKQKLPPGWLDCPPAGQEICGMIPSKVPLSEGFGVTPGRRYSFKQVIRQQAVSGRKLGLVIDLTNTTRYYSTNEFKKEGIKHIKIQCRGRDAVPENVAVNQFVFEVMQFLSQQKLTKKYILVHCTHGHNRTGYMIVHFLMRTQLMSVAQAITKFAEARPPGIYKPDYIDALYAFYHEKKPDHMFYPPLPGWKNSELDLNGEAVPDDDDDDGNSVAPLHSNQETEAKLTNDDVLGDDIPSDQLNALRHTCYQMLKLTAPGRGAPQFPGSHPVSLNRENLQLLRQRYYYATWKADGTRYMMLITMDGCYLVDRSFNFRRVQMRFPCKGGSDVPCDKMHHFTLLDGEMVIDTLPDTQKQERRYLIYDLMAINHVPVVERPFSERWKMIEKEVLGPRNAERHNAYLSRDFPYRYEMEPFRVRRKDFWLLSTVTKLLRDFIPKLSHEADGLIFQGWDDPYVPKTHNGLLKWKYPEMNSVDFLFEVNADGRQSLCLFERGKKKPMDGQRVEFKDDDPSSYSGKIIECSWDKHKEVWECMRVRTDKNAPNEINTYRKVMRSITDNITEAVLLGEINEIIRLPMYADRINNDSKAAARRR